MKFKIDFDCKCRIRRQPKENQFLRGKGVYIFYLLDGTTIAK